MRRHSLRSFLAAPRVSGDGPAPVKAAKRVFDASRIRASGLASIQALETMEGGSVSRRWRQHATALESIARGSRIRWRVGNEPR